MKFFHRYQSTIHGNYRRAYLRCGFIAGMLLSLYILVRHLIGLPAESPESYISDAILLLSIFLFAIAYRNALPDKSVTLKELMLFGIGTALVASILYALLLWAFCIAVPQQTALFVLTMTGDEITVDDPQINYWAAAWTLVTGIKMAVLGSFGAFLAAVIFKNEKPEIKTKH